MEVFGSGNLPPDLYQFGTIKMAEAENIKHFTFKLNKLQFETVQSLFNHYDWNFEECVVGINKTFDSENSENIGIQLLEQEVPQTNREYGDNNGDYNGDNNGNNDGNNNQNFGAEIHQNVLNEECMFCYCSPCITENRQTWLGNPVPAHARNSGLRKSRYRKFWNMMDRRGAWIDQRYLQKKADLLGIRDNNQDNVWTMREVMPQCILDQVRTTYPNPTGQPYMGHMWW